jgi:hypothetical protein
LCLGRQVAFAELHDGPEQVAYGPLDLPSEREAPCDPMAYLEAVAV